MNEVLLKALHNFKIYSEIMSIEPYGSGHINVTYLVTTNDKRYILQKINSNLFTNIDGLMSNISMVTNHIKKYFPDKTTLTLVKTIDDNYYYHDESGYYRVYDFIENTVCLQIPENKQEFYESAVSFGDFANMLSTFDASKLYEVIPNFHNTVERYRNFIIAVDNNYKNRLSEVTKEVEFVKWHKDYCNIIVDLLSSKYMPLKVTHNDTKLNNVLLDKETFKGIAVIDLDTIMPGSICYDFGDSIRFGCNSSFEDEKDLSKVYFKIDLFEEYVKGFLKSLSSSITLVEKDNLVNGAIIMTLECGIRFLTDYLNGDTYFKTSREGQNLDRCRTQFKLVEDMESCKEEMKKIVNKYYEMFCVR